MAFPLSSLHGLGSMPAIRSTVNTTSGFASSSLDPLPSDIRHGMIAMGIIGLFSSVSTISLFIFITYRMISWRRFYDHPIASNQIFVLIYNLLLADFQQGLSFLFSFHWVAQNRLVGPTGACFAQGWLIQIGDISSGFWVLSIGVHTFVNLVLHRSIPMKVFIPWVVSLWAFCLILTAVGPITHRNDFFVPAGAWCWINSKHEGERLYLHYVWIFLAEVGSVSIYTTVFFFLRNQLADVAVKQNSSGLSSSMKSENREFSKGNGITTTTTIITISAADPFLVSRQRIAKAARYMVVYPFAYVTLTLPLAAGRVAAMAGKNVPLVYLVVAGALMSSCGFVDVLLYIYTRKALVRSSVGVKSDKITSNGLTRLQSRKKDARDSIRMEGLQVPAEEGRSLHLPIGTIMVSQSVTRSEDSFGTTVAASPAVSRSESLKSLVDKDEGRDGSWLA